MNIRITYPLLLICCLLCTIAHAHAQAPAPDWRTVESAHFKVNFRPENRQLAHQTLSIAEQVHSYVTQELDWVPRGKTQLVLIGSVDFANGFATPLPYNQSGIFLTAPNNGGILNRDDWLETVLLHEYVHIVHLDKVHGFPKALRSTLGRMPFAFPNLFQPNWVTEGLATYYESAPNEAIGRLQNSKYEAQMRDELRHGFMSLREINARGTRAPLNRAYLYGSYFFEFMHRRYGKKSIYRYINDYSDNLIPFRLHSNPRGATGKSMDELWQEFLTDLQQQITQRNAAILTTPAVVGEHVEQQFYRDMSTLKSTKNGDTYAVVEDGITRPQLLKYSQDGNKRRLTRVRNGSAIDVRDDNTVLIAQPEICGNVSVYFDLYRYAQNKLKRLTTCGRYLRAKWSRSDDGAQAIVAIRNKVDRQQIVMLDENGENEHVILEGTRDMRWIDLDSTTDGQGIVLIGLQAGEFGIYELIQGSAQTKLLVKNNATKHSIHFSSDENYLYFVSDQSGAPNVWRYHLATAQIERLTHAHTAITALAGDDAEGTLTLTTLVQGHYQLHRLPSPVAINDHASTTASSIKSESSVAIRPSLPFAAATPLADVTQALPGEYDYNAFDSLRPRYWIPVSYADADTFAIGVSLSGSDVLNHHAYFFQPIVEISQNEILGVAAYSYSGYLNHSFSVSRNMQVTKVIEVDDTDEAVEYETDIKAQWTSTVPLLSIDSRFVAGMGAAVSQERLHHINGNALSLSDQRLAAGFLSFSTATANILSEGYSEGIRIRLLYESYGAFDSNYDGAVTRVDLNGYLPLASTVVALRVTDVRATKRTEPFQLGGAYVEFASAAPSLNSRHLPLRGYKGNQAALEGENARLLTLEWRVPVMNVDRHLMVPPIGLKRVSASVFFESGAVWGPDESVASFDDNRAYGVEVRGQLVLGYRWHLPLRVGIARGVGELGETQVYGAIGMNF